MKVLVLGHKGMLGHMVSKLLIFLRNRQQFNSCQKRSVRSVYFLFLQKNNLVCLRTVCGCLYGQIKDRKIH